MAGFLRSLLFLLRRAFVASYSDNILLYAKSASYSGLLSFIPLVGTLAALLFQANAVAVSQILAQLLGRLAPGAITGDRPAMTSGEGAALIEAFRGDVFVDVRLVDGRLAHVHARDASWFQWPLLEAAIEGNIVADFPLCNKSFNCSYSGHDL